MLCRTESGLSHCPAACFGYPLLYTSGSQRPLSDKVSLNSAFSMETSTYILNALLCTAHSPILHADILITSPPCQAAIIERKRPITASCSSATGPAFRKGSAPFLLPALAAIPTGAGTIADSWVAPGKAAGTGAHLFVGLPLAIPQSSCCGAKLRGKQKGYWSAAEIGDGCASSAG